MKRRLYRARTGRIVEGVCAGIANYFALDPSLVRLLWVLFTAMGGGGIVAYIVCAIVIPEEPEGL